MIPLESKSQSFEPGFSLITNVIDVVKMAITAHGFGTGDRSFAHPVGECQLRIDAQMGLYLWICVRR